jgi:ubiquinone/menaquinone biosynthesis C-methylase UbiE
MFHFVDAILTRRCLRLVPLLLLLAVVPFAQEQSVKPGINENFIDPDVDRYIQMFEGESREIFKHRDEIVAALGLKPGTNVADVGAGTGFFSRMIAEKVQPGGVVYAVDIARNFLDHIEKLNKENNITNIKTVLCDQHSTQLPENSVDVVFVCDTYHHFEFPQHTLESIHKALRPGGTLVIVDFERIKGVSTDFAVEHVRAGKGTVSDEIRDAGFDFIEEVPMMKEQYVIKFRKREPKGP